MQTRLERVVSRHELDGTVGEGSMNDQFVVKRLEKDADAESAFCCMSEVPTPWPKTLGICRAWAGLNLGRYVEGYHVQDPVGTVVGQLYFATSERALVPYEIEDSVAVMYCVWVQRRHQRQGLGRKLFTAFEADMYAQGYKGILVEGTDREELMHYQHFLPRGFQVVHEYGHRKLLYLPLKQSRIELRPLESRIRPRRGLPVEILILSGYLCPFEASTQILLTEVAREFGERVVIRQEPLSPETLERYGVADGIFINGRQKLSGAVSEEAIRQAIVEEFE
jgi:ribosomal protein S18 acetylase RimI-like enzyme